MLFRAAPLTLVALLAACASTSEVDSDKGAEDPGASSANGIIFKGPMAEGSTITFQPVDQNLAPNGDPITLSVEDYAGAYAGAMPFAGWAEITAQGTAFNEAEGAQKDDETVTLHAWADLDGAVAANLNVLTELTHRRVEVLVADGADLGEAIAQAEAEFHAALGWTSRDPVEELGGEIDPYGDSYDQSWIFAISSIIAQAGRDFGRPDGDSTNGDMRALAALLDDLRNGFGETGQLTDTTKDVIRTAESLTDPDLAMLGLTAHFEDHDLGYSLPDLHPAMDSDHDGLVNSEDNCRYVSNSDQSTLDDGYRFGAACDTRLSDIATTEEWGCGILSATGEITCWNVQSAPTGGTPPRPDVFPSAPGTPWGPGAFPGLYSEMDLDASGPTDSEGLSHHLACAVDQTGRVDCWDGETPASPFSLPDKLRQLRVSGDRICGLEIGGDAICYDRTGADRLMITGPFVDLDIKASQGICAIAADTHTLQCYDLYGNPSAEGLPTSAVKAVATNDALGVDFGCALLADDGSVACWGEMPFSPPAGAGFVSLTVGRFVACAADETGALTCSRDETECPALEDSPPPVGSLATDLCVTCGLDPEGLGACWPRFWTQQRAEAGGAP